MGKNSEALGLEGFHPGAEGAGEEKNTLSAPQAPKKKLTVTGGNQKILKNEGRNSEGSLKSGVKILKKFSSRVLSRVVFTLQSSPR